MTTKKATKPAAKPKRKAGDHPFVGRYVLCRCYSAGVHTGTLVSLDGIKKGSKVDAANPEIALTGVIEIIPCSAEAEESINGQ